LFSNQKKTTLLAVGECMAELSFTADTTLSLSFAGDTYNALVYAKRCQANIKALFFTGLGKDALTAKMLAEWEKQGVDGKHAVKVTDNNVGIYLIQNDDSGERYFDYWRENSAARYMFSDENATLPQADMVLFSGISLGILPEPDKDRLLTSLQELQQKGAQVVFDPNYRAAMWQGQAHAQEWMSKAYALSDIALPGMDDQTAIYNHSSVDEVAAFLGQHGIKEAVIKAGKQGVYGFADKKVTYHSEFKPAPKQVDSTAAGDSFAGAYLAGRLSGQSQADAISQAEDVARIVVQHPGAIIDSSALGKLVITP